MLLFKKHKNSTIITLFNSITMFCETDNIQKNILYREYSLENCQSHKTLLWILIMLCLTTPSTHAYKIWRTSRTLPEVHKPQLILYMWTQMHQTNYRSNKQILKININIIIKSHTLVAHAKAHAFASQNLYKLWKPLHSFDLVTIYLLSCIEIQIVPKQICRQA